MSSKVTPAEEAESFAIHEAIAGRSSVTFDGAWKSVRWSFSIQPGPPELESNIRIVRGAGYEASISSSFLGG